ncbi:FAD-dependent oxidoreductase [[Clostridium] fimetarium]|uniref:Glucose inhibited division protein A n=1 Tax=[Clostridium] fimetarium TaxID=99656 RepID=A0A1I0Q7Q8_9FIRM|nr:FAD-dependent oxidoreductase [[Clostridium] fimetarium]SEW22826.1 Glucose inhibited division protein A [[Clostridium] fimetarium]
MKIIITGGGWAGCSAAYMARKQGAEVVLIERTDSLLGTGLVGGIMRNNGRFTATEELIAMGGGEIFKIIDQNCRHTNISFPGHEHASLYDIAKTPVAITNYLLEIGVEVKFIERVVKAHVTDGAIQSIETASGNVYEGDAFIDTTGTAGPMKNCIKYGNGCAMCIIRCPSYGGRVSLAGICGISEITGKKADDSIGAMSGSCKLYKESLSPEIIEALNTKGVAVIPIPKELIENHLSAKACQQYALKEFSENMVLLDTGHAKLMTPFYSLEKLHKIPGFENARYEDPYAGGKGNSMRFFDMAPRTNALQVIGLKNLFCAGEKAGLLVGHTEAIVTGVLAGYNATRHISNMPLLEISRKTAFGEAVAYVNEEMQTKEGLGKKYTFSGSVLFEHMKKLNLYETDVNRIQENIKNEGLWNVFAC